MTDADTTPNSQQAKSGPQRAESGTKPRYVRAGVQHGLLTESLKIFGENQKFLNFSSDRWSTLMVNGLDWKQPRDMV